MALVPDAVLANWATWWPGRVDELSVDLERRWEQAVAAWRLVGARPLPGGEVALVQAARVGAREVVVKLNPDAGDPSFADEAAALTELARAGLAPEVLCTRDGGLTLLMARVRPGGSLAIDPKSAVGDPHADVFVFFDGPPLRDLEPAPVIARAQLRRRIAAFAGAAGLEHDRVAVWVRLRALVALAQPEDGLNRRARSLSRLVDALG